MFLGEARLAKGLRVYAIGDIHGRADCLSSMLSLIGADIVNAPIDSVQIVFLGDYTDRGPASRDVIDCLVELSIHPHVICLRGNHDEALGSFLSDPEGGAAFLRWGGRETLASYGVDTGSGRSNAQMSAELLRAMPQSHRRFLSGLKTSWQAGDYFFCHAGVRPGIDLDQQDPHDLMWIRGEFHDHEGCFGKVIVHGHTPRDQVDILPNRINVDTGAYANGRLSCVVLEGREHRLLQTRGL